MATAFRLVSGGQSLTFRGTNPTGSDPISVSTYSLGYPNPRVVDGQYAGTSGKYDFTTFHDDRTVTFNLKIVGDGSLTSREIIYSQLSAMCHPNNRPILYILRSDFGGIERSMTLRADPLTNSVTSVAAAYYEVSLQFTCLSGLMDDAGLTYLNIPVTSAPIGFGLPANAYASAGAGALVYAATGIGTAIRASGTGLEFPASSGANSGIGQSKLALGTGFALTAAPSSGSTVVVNTGSVPSSPRFFLYGQADNPILRNDTTGQQLAFTANGGAKIPSGQFLDVDVINKTVFMNSNPSSSLYSKINWTVSSWWNLAAGVNNIAYGASNFDNLAQLQITFTRHWI